MKWTEIMIDALIKHGLGGDIKNFKTTVDIPRANPIDPPMRITITAEDIQIKVERN